LNLLALSYFKGNIWAGNTKANIASFVDERADQQQREALQKIFTGKAGGFMAQVSNLVEEDRGLYFAPIKLEVADDLSYWSAEIPNKARPPAAAEAIIAAVLSRGLLDPTCSGLTNCAFHNKYRIAIADRTVPMAIFAITT
jgi:hypothetical protein